ncbi:hypothetical protein EDB85DRAFT_1826064, partial [Lactarius pseudohatsudake]
EKTNPVSSKGHIIVRQLPPHACLYLVLMTKLTSLHVPSIYMLSSSDLPLLTFLRDTTTKLLTSLLPMDLPLLSPTSAGPLNTTSTQPYTRPSNFRIGFITPLFRDSRIP